MRDRAPKSYGHEEGAQLFRTHIQDSNRLEPTAMAAKSAGMHRTKAKAKEAAAGAGVRDRIRDLSVAAFRDHKLTVRDISKLANEVLDGAVQSIDKSIPQSSRNVLREVFVGLSVGVHTIASAGL